jgi:long-chain acyl-CoA synthetase
MRGPGGQAAAAIEHANARLAEFQRLSRWVLWPEPDLPRTSTGKVRRKVVAEWLAGIQAAATRSGAANLADASAYGASSDWLLALIAQISGEAPHGVGDELRLTEDLHLDSLGRVQLAAAIEERMSMAPESGLLEEIQTVGDLRRLLGADPDEKPSAPQSSRAPSISPSERARSEQNQLEPPNLDPSIMPQEPQAKPASAKNLYPHWPWLLPFRGLRAIFVEAVMRPLVKLLANPSVVSTEPSQLNADAPMLIVANHATAYDGPLLEYALPGPMRRRIAVAMSGEMLEAYRHFRNPERVQDNAKIYLPGPLFYLLLTALFNVFPLPRLRDFQRSFAHAGEALDRGFNVLIFPEGTRSAEGRLAAFRPGIGLLVKQSETAVLPMAIRGLGELKTRRRSWFRSGAIEVRVGQPMRFSSTVTEASITAQLHAAVEKLLNEK